jgi:hypothetical protein
MLHKRRAFDFLPALVLCLTLLMISVSAGIRDRGNALTLTRASAPRALFIYLGLPILQPPATVLVDCTKGESINKVLAKSSPEQSLIIEIRGLCSENVVITRDRVTLRGANPANDGIVAIENTESIDAAIWVRGAHLVTLENLKLTGGFSGLLATDANLPHLRVINCRLEGNSAYGMQLQMSLVEVSNSAFGPNGNVNAGVFGGSRFQCSNCTLADPQGGGPLGALRHNVLMFAASRILFDNCTLTNGGILSDDSLMLITDSILEQFAPNGGSITAASASSVILTRVQVKGVMRFNQGTNTQLLGVTQTPVAGTPPNSVDDSAFVRVADASPAAGGPPSIASVVLGFQLRNFSNFSLLQTSQISGSMNCSLGANAFCSTPASVSGNSNCGLCPKP